MGPPAWTLSLLHFMATPLFVFFASREQEGTESDEGQLPQVVEELRDLQVAPGTCLAKFQLKVKGRVLGSGHRSWREARSCLPLVTHGKGLTSGGQEVMCACCWATGGCHPTPTPEAGWPLSNLFSGPLSVSHRKSIVPIENGPVLTTLLHGVGYPVPRLYWFKDGQPLSTSAHIRMADKKTLHTLEIVSVTREDAGQYAAYISNAVGAAYSSARLLVRGVCPEGVSSATCTACQAPSGWAQPIAPMHSGTDGRIAPQERVPSGAWTP